MDPKATRGRRIGITYINAVLIPLLRRKAGVPGEDARGRVTSHWARSTIATQLYNAKEPMSLFELQEWLGHRSPRAPGTTPGSPRRGWPGHARTPATSPETCARSRC